MEFAFLGVSILIIVFFHFREKKKWGNLQKKNFVLIQDQKNTIANQLENIIRLEKSELELLQEAKKYNSLKIDLMELKISVTNTKEELEYIASRSGLEKMDDGVIYRLIKDNHKHARLLLSNWLPYGRSLGELDLIDSFIKKMD